MDGGVTNRGTKVSSGFIAADMHSHFLLGGKFFRRDFFTRHRGTHYWNPFMSNVDFPRAMEYGLRIMTFTAYVTGSPVGELRTWRKLVKVLDFFDDTVGKGGGKLVKVTRAEDAWEVAAQGKMAGILALEGAHPLGNDISRLDYLYRRGVRMVTLAHLIDNNAADSGWDPRRRNRGLSSFGRILVKRMNELGMIVDTAHCSDEAFDEVLDLSSHPVICSHTGLRELMPSRRNLTLSQVKRIAGSGGVVGIIMHRPYLHRLPWKADVKRVLEEMMMVIDRAGVDCIAVGTDFDGMTWAPAGVNSYAFIELMRNELVRKGMGEDDLHKIFSGNYLRVMRQVCGGSS